MKQKRALRRGWLRKFAALTALVTAAAGLNLVGPQEAQAANSLPGTAWCGAMSLKAMR